jgi:hypothetical protein
VTRVSWPPVLAHAEAIVESYDTGVTLRQLFYRVASDGTLPNTKSYYQRLSEYTAEARRTGGFPELLDRTSRIERAASFDGVVDALDWLRDIYRRDRTEGQPWTIYLGVEKAGLSEQLDAWFGDELGLPIVALGGYASQSLVKKVRDDIERQGRPAVCIYAGDLDPTGEDIDRDFEERVGVFDKVIRVALSEAQLTEFGVPDFELTDAEKKKVRADSRWPAFRARHPELTANGPVQYEVDALPPETLRDLYRTAIEQFWDPEAHRSVLAREDTERARIAAILDGLDGTER